MFISRIKRILLALAVAVTGAFSAAGANMYAPDAHRSLTIYQIMVASFQHSPEGAPGYKAMWGPDGHTKNGNLRGIINALDHIRSLGVNAIWLTPIFDSSTATGGEKLQATGYFTNNFFAIDPHFGTEADFKELVDEAHKRDMYVLLDGVFGHHGGVSEPSPLGNVLDVTVTHCDRPDGGTGNISYPGSLDYIKEVATYWIDKYGVDGWRLDQAYQAMQGHHNYWNEIRGAVEELAEQRRARGEKWGVLGYMVGEDWGNAEVINNGVYRDGGLLSAFDFQGKERISGAMQDPLTPILPNGWKDVINVLSTPRERGYLNDYVLPNLFLTNHDGFRVADHIDPTDPYYYEKLMTLHAILAAYSGPVTLYYGDEYADNTRSTVGAQKDNIARTSGHLEPRNEKEKELKDYISKVMELRRSVRALTHGQASFKHVTNGVADVLIVTKTDSASGSKAVVIFSDRDVVLPVEGLSKPVSVRAWIPEFVVLK